MPTYQQVHRHLDKTRGLASSHLCQCGDPVGIGKHQKSNGHTGWVVVP